MTKILLVEDDKSLREIYGVRLLAEGYDIVSAGDGEEALAMAIKERPQLILADVMMPKISGFDMLDILRSTTETKSIKVIMMTALSSEDQRARGEALGADRYLVKSQVGIEDVVRTVHEVLADAPVRASATNSFTTPRPAPSAPPAPATSTPPRPAIQAVPPRAPEAPPVAAATPRPPAPTPQPPMPVSTPRNGLPQPTAPFSTNRPASLGDRVIHPISRPDEAKVDIASRMEQELNAAVPAPSITPPAAPTPANEQNPPAATPPQPVANIPVAPPPPPVPPQATVAPFAQPKEQPSTPPIAFEETPRLTPPPPPPGAGAQPNPPA